MTPAALQAWRAQAGLSQTGLAALLGIHALTISRWERGERSIPPLLKWALAGVRCFTEHNHAKRGVA